MLHLKNLLANFSKKIYSCNNSDQADLVHNEDDILEKCWHLLGKFKAPHNDIYELYST